MCQASMRCGAVGLMLALLREIPAAHREAAQGHFPITPKDRERRDGQCRVCTDELHYNANRLSKRHP